MIKQDKNEITNTECINTSLTTYDSDISKMKIIFDFSEFHIKYKSHLPTNTLPSYRFLS